MKFILFEGKIETLAFFSARLAEVLIRRGFEVYTHGFYDGTEALEAQIRDGDTVLITFNCIGISGEEEYMRDSVSIWRLHSVRIVNILVDHPMYYHDQLKNISTYATDSGLVHTVCIDRFHMRYVRDYYPETANVHFMVLAGSGSEYAVPYRDKKYDIIFTGNFTPCSHFERFFNANGPEYAEFYRGIADDLLSDASRPVEQVCLEHIRREFPDAPPGELRFTISKFLFIDLYVRFRLREKAIAALADAGLNIRLVGHGFEAIRLKNGRTLSGGTLLPTAYCLKETALAKISLNVMPGFCDGGHDRIVSSMLCGTPVLSDPSIWLMENFRDGEDIFYYDNMHMEKLPETAANLLGNPKLLRVVAENGQKKALESHTWESRAGELLAILP